jgi:hypothetical protein
MARRRLGPKYLRHAHHIDSPQPTRPGPAAHSGDSPKIAAATYTYYHMLACRSCDVRRPDSCHQPKYPSLLPSMLVTTSHSTRVHAGVEPIPSQSPLPRCEAICLECHLSLQRLGESTVAVPAFVATHPLALSLQRLGESTVAVPAFGATPPSRMYRGLKFDRS